jgi:hypothetical protein
MGSADKPGAQNRKSREVEGSTVTRTNATNFDEPTEQKPGRSLARVINRDSSDKDSFHNQEHLNFIRENSDFLA